MPASIDYEPTTPPLARVPPVPEVFRYEPESTDQPYVPLPNIACVAVQYKEGAEAPVARFRYRFDQLEAEWPTEFEEVYPLDAWVEYVIRNDDRLVVMQRYPDGAYGILFDGHAQIPQVDVGPDTQVVTFSAFSVAVREWDTPLPGALYRSSAAPATSDEDTATDLPVRFNPDGQANASPADHDSGTAPDAYPVFLDPNSPDQDDPPRPWTLDMAVRYLIARGNPEATWTTSPTFDGFTDFLKAWVPAEGHFMDPDDPSDYVKKDIPIPDIDLTGEVWPEAVWKLIEPHGIGMAFRLDRDEAGKPRTYLDFYRKDVLTNLKQLRMQPYGEILDPGRTNVQALHLARDISHVATRITVDTEPVRYEASFVLAPGFAPITTADATTEGVKQYKKGAGSNAALPPGYRRFVLGEDGGGYWDFATSATKFTATSLRAVLSDMSLPVVDQEQQYVHKPRPGHGTLISTNEENGKLEKELWISKDYAGNIPGVWDGSGTWQRVNSGGWKLLEDVLGVELTMPDPETWDIGKSTDTEAPFWTGKVRVVKSLADPDAANPRFVFRLTCVIEADHGLEAVAEPRGVSPTAFAITRRIDARDKYKKEVISNFSHFNDSGEDVIVRDDTEAAKAHARAQQAASELARFAGTVTIPRFTLAYRVGDKLEKIDGRDLSLRTNIGGNQGEAPVYPTIVGIDWEFEGGQRTVLHLSDERARPPRPGRNQ